MSAGSDPRPPRQLSAGHANSSTSRDVASSLGNHGFNPKGDSHMVRCSYLVACCAGLAFAAPALAQQLPAHIRVVDAAAAPGGDGRSWATAYESLHTALEVAAASGGAVTEVWVAQGEYTTALAPHKQCQSFTVLTGISVYGGFTGVETSPMQRPSGAQSTLRAFGCYSSTNAPVVRILATAPVVFDGFFLDQVMFGLSALGPATLRNVRIQASTGYAISASGPGLTIENCWIQGSGNGDTPIRIYGPATITNSHLSGSHPMSLGMQLRNITIRNSTVLGGGESLGMDADGVTFEDCTITVGSFVRGMQAIDSSMLNCHLTASSSIGEALTANNLHADRSQLQLDASASGSSTALRWTGGSIRRSRIQTSTVTTAMVLAHVPVRDSILHLQGWLSLSGAPTFANTRFTGGGRISAALNQVASPRFVNCLFQHNTTWPEHVIVVQPQWRFDNCIIWGNRETEAEIFNVPAGLTGFINHSIVRGWSGQYGGAGNSGANPLLNPDGTLQPGSPAIDAGINAALPPQTLYDLAGNCRIVDGDHSGTAIVDIGPFEFGPCAANCDCSTAAPVLNIADFSCFLQRFAAADPWANCDESTTPPVLNIADFSCFLQRFAQGCP
jgi:hypothetical protein